MATFVLLKMMSRLDAFLEESREAVPSLSPLPNRLVEVAVIVGVDENSGLNVVKDEDQSVSGCWRLFPETAM